MATLAAANDGEVWVAYTDVVGVTDVTLGAGGVARFEFRDWDRTVVGRDAENRIWFNGTDGIVILWPDGHLRRLNHANVLIWDDLSPWTGTREEVDGSYQSATSRGLSRYKRLGEAKKSVWPYVV